MHILQGTGDSLASRFPNRPQTRRYAQTNIYVIRANAKTKKRNLLQADDSCGDVVSVPPETGAEPSLQATQMRLKRARLADNLNEKISQRPGPMELVEKNILPVDSSVKTAIIGEGQSNGDDNNLFFNVAIFDFFF